ncbi:stage III sporulation protein AA [Clostridium minihomine]|uniref:stage III sporulation protein AA n=1 Tax=Clostridium minihomine TaxID=2045012 RepID=UPI000C784CC3|nr:stage III sporulation protein AA [Clostridium minihomine]
MKQNSTSAFHTALQPVSRRLKPVLEDLPEHIKESAQEIRLRVNRPISIFNGVQSFFVTGNGISRIPQEGITVFREDMDETFQNLCSHSVYTHQNEIKNGFITIRGGHRVGICGTAVLEQGEITGLRDISSFNIRVARQVEGAADDILTKVGDEILRGILLAGAPSTGKTTILRDIARQLSCGDEVPPRKIVVIDERGELAGTYQGDAQNDLGCCCDVLDGYPKSQGILQAIRSLSPEIILCDELGGEKETAAVEEVVNAGVSIIVSVHASSAGDLLRRRQVRRLLETGAFRTVVLLDSAAQPGKIKGIYKVGELLGQINRDSGSGSSLYSGGLYGIA